MMNAEDIKSLVSGVDDMDNTFTEPAPGTISRLPNAKDIVAWTDSKQHDALLYAALTHTHNLTSGSVPTVAIIIYTMLSLPSYPVYNATTPTDEIESKPRRTPGNCHEWSNCILDFKGDEKGCNKAAAMYKFLQNECASAMNHAGVSVDPSKVSRRYFRVMLHVVALYLGDIHAVYDSFWGKLCGMGEDEEPKKHAKDKKKAVVAVHRFVPLDPEEARRWLLKMLKENPMPMAYRATVGKVDNGKLSLSIGFLASFQAPGKPVTPAWVQERREKGHTPVLPVTCLEVSDEKTMKTLTRMWHGIGKDVARLTTVYANMDATAIRALNTRHPVECIPVLQVYHAVFTFYGDLIRRVYKQAWTPTPATTKPADDDVKPYKKAAEEEEEDDDDAPPRRPKQKTPPLKPRMIPKRRKIERSSSRSPSPVVYR